MWIMSSPHWLEQNQLLHYQKIDKYKRKYWGNIFVDKLPTDFTDKNIPSVFTEGIIVEKNLNKEKKWWRAIFTNGIIDRLNFIGKIIGKLWTLFIMSITKRITDGNFRRYFIESSGTIHFLIALLIIVFYRQNHRWIEKPSVLFGGFLKKLA